ncbi:MAG: cupin domain-containing protein [Acidisphaera sp.]|nr:cupin domain-containing protein [Acidisphaera sp.]
MRQIHVKAGHVATRHSHPHEQFLYVLSGAAELQCEAGSVPLRPGTAIRFAPNAWHSAEFTSDTILVEFNLAQ